MSKEELVEELKRQILDAQKIAYDRNTEIKTQIYQYGYIHALNMVLHFLGEVNL